MAFAELQVDWRNGNTAETGTPAVGDLFRQEYENIYEKINALHAAIFSSFGQKLGCISELNGAEPPRIGIGVVDIGGTPFQVTAPVAGTFRESAWGRPFKEHNQWYVGIWNGSTYRCYIVPGGTLNLEARIMAITNPTGSTIRYLFSDSVDLSAVRPGHLCLAKGTAADQNEGVFKITAVQNTSGTYDGLNGVKYVEADYASVVMPQTRVQRGTLNFFLNQDGATGTSNETNPPHLAMYRNPTRNGFYDAYMQGDGSWRAMHVFYVNSSGAIQWIHDTGVGLEWRNCEGWAIGQPQIWPVHFAPPGAIALEGTEVDRGLYPRLFAAIGTGYGAGDGSATFNLPDLRGEFIRGWDKGRGVDPGRVFGSSQASANREHEHRYGSYGPGPSNYLTGDGRWWSGPTTGTTASSGGSESRPRNVAMLYCCRY